MHVVLMIEMLKRLQTVDNSAVDAKCNSVPIQYIMTAQITAGNDAAPGDQDGKCSECN